MYSNLALDNRHRLEQWHDDFAWQRSLEWFQAKKNCMSLGQSLRLSLEYIDFPWNEGNSQMAEALYHNSKERNPSMDSK